MPGKPTYEELEQRVRELEQAASEHRRSGEKARRAAREWAITFDAASDAIWIMDTDQRVQRANQMARAFFLGPKDDVAGKHCWELIHGTNGPIAHCPALRTKKSLVREVMELHLGDQWFQVTVDPILDMAGRHVGFVHILREITKRKLAEKALAESEKKFRLVTETIQGVFWMSTPGVTQMLYVSPGYEKIWRKSSTDLYASPRDFLEIIHPEDIQSYLNVLDAFHAKGKAYQCEYRILPETGSVRWIHERGYPIADHHGNATLMTGLCTDITDRKQAKDALRQSEEQYRSMMAAFIDPLYICSPGFVVEYMNPAMIRRIGRDATGEKCHQALHGLEATCSWCIYDSLSRSQPVDIDIRSPLDHKTYRVTNMPIHNQDGTVSKMSIFRDITDYLKAVEDKEKAQIQLLQAQKMDAIGNLAGGIAHDFNNILTSIIGFTELALNDVEKGSTVEESLEEVYIAGKRARDLVDQMLTFARQTDEPMRPIPIDAIVEEIVKLLRSSTPATIDFQQRIGSKSLVMGNPSQIHQIVMNLCTNAVHAMDKSGGILTIALRKVTVKHGSALHRQGLAPGDFVEMTVSDTGPGIPSDVLDLIFEPYFTTKAMGEGIGWGLSVVQGIVENSGGKIVVDSRVGKGTTFRVYLPATKALENSRRQESPALSTGAERILFVDDEIQLAKLGGQVLEALGYSVTARSDSIEALALFSAMPNAFDLIVSDLTMPKMTGDVLAKKALAIRPDIPVIILTGYNKRLSSASAIDIGISALAYKPFVQAELSRTIRKVLDEARNKTRKEMKPS